MAIRAGNFLADDEFTEQEQLIIEMSARGSSHRQMADECKITTRHIARKLAEPKIRLAIRRFCRDLFELRMRQMQTHWEKMEKCFVDILDDDAAETFAKIAAATQIKTMCFQARDNDFEDEMDELRERVQLMESKLGGGPAAEVRVIEHAEP
jgi:hypothetical protein